MGFYVIKDSSKDEDIVTLLKAEPLSVEEVNEYGEGHVNMNTRSNTIYYGDKIYYQTAADNNGYGGMQYYSNETCGYSSFTGSLVFSGCINDYESSEVKYVIDSWALDNFNVSDLKEARLITIDEIDVETRQYDCCGGCGTCIATGTFPKYDWFYNDKYSYWTSSAYNSSLSDVWAITSNGNVGSQSVNDSISVRPVVVISKSVLGNESESIVDDKDTNKEENAAESKETNNIVTKKVNVPNTYLSSLLIFIIFGFIFAGISIVIYYKVSNKNKERK